MMEPNLFETSKSQFLSSFISWSHTHEIPTVFTVYVTLRYVHSQIFHMTNHANVMPNRVREW